jgi:hypothetical protein
MGQGSSHRNQFFLIWFSDFILQLLIDITGFNLYEMQEI